MPRIHPIRLLLFALVSSVTLLGGCANWYFGSHAIFPPAYKTVHVKMFVPPDQSRFGEAQMLTEAIQKRIEQVTPYKLVGSPMQADLIIEGRIASASKRTTQNHPSGYALQTSENMVVQAKLVINRQRLRPNQGEAIDLAASGNGKYYPLAGQSYASANQKTVEEAARRLVAQLEVLW